MRLIELTTAPKSAQRFDQLSIVTGDGIIGAVWFYSAQEAEALQASLDTLPRVVHALRAGTARFLKVRLRKGDRPPFLSARSRLSFSL